MKVANGTIEARYFLDPYSPEEPFIIDVGQRFEGERHISERTRMFLTEKQMKALIRRLQIVLAEGTEAGFSARAIRDLTAPQPDDGKVK